MKGLDDDIEVVTCTPDGFAKVWGPVERDGKRRYHQTRDCGNYGNAKLWADEYEDRQRAERPAPRR